MKKPLNTPFCSTKVLATLVFPVCGDPDIPRRHSGLQNRQLLRQSRCRYRGHLRPQKQVMLCLRKT